MELKDILLRAFTQEILNEFFPREKTDKFFEALYGDIDEGTYDIVFTFQGVEKNRLLFEFHLKRREGKCLACSLTYGLPQVFKKHPVIDIEGLIKKIEEALANINIQNWELGQTREESPDLHVIPLYIEFTKKQELSN